MVQDKEVQGNCLCTSMFRETQMILVHIHHGLPAVSLWFGNGERSGEIEDTNGIKSVLIHANDILFVQRRWLAEVVR